MVLGLERLALGQDRHVVLCAKFCVSGSTGTSFSQFKLTNKTALGLDCRSTSRGIRKPLVFLFVDFKDLLGLEQQSFSFDCK